MKYTTTLTIERPRHEVWKKFDNFENLKEWQPSLVSYESISGEPGTPGAKTRMLYKEGKREMEMIETFGNRIEGERMDGVYTAKGVWNHVEVIMEDTDEGFTHFSMVSEFKFSGFMRIVAPLMKSMFEKRTAKDLNRFKEFVESN